MSKRKVKTTGYCRVVVEDEETFRWGVGPHVFQYGPAVGNFNLCIVIDGTAVPMVHAKSLAEAGIFAEGYALGRACQG